MEIALAVVLLTFAGLLAKSFAGLLRVHLGYRADRLLTFHMALPASRYPNQEARLQFWNRLLPQVAVSSCSARLCPRSLCSAPFVG